VNELALLLLFLGALAAFAKWRSVFALCVVTALLQDPLRKLVPGQPVYFIAFVAVVFAAAWIAAFAGKVKLAPGSMVGWKEYLGHPFVWFLVLAALQCINSLLSYGNPVMTAIGLSSYLAPLPAVVLAYRFALDRGEAGVRSWMRFYVVLATLALGTIYLEFAGLSWPVLGEVGEGVFISGSGAYYRGNAGVFRAAEIAAWHAAAVACFAFILFWGRRFSPPKFLLALAFIAFLVGAGALTGRRKMVIEIAMFLTVYFCLLGWFQKGSARLAIGAAVLGLGIYASSLVYLSPGPGDSPRASERVENTGPGFSKYAERAGTVFEDLPGRLLDTGLRPVQWAVAGHGWTGGGIGVGSQGAQHFGAESSGAAEGGLGKLTVELGLPGLALVAWLLICLLRYVNRILTVLAATSPSCANLAYGLVAFIAANAAAFSVATQAFADFFILLSLGWSFGFLLALPVLAAAPRRTQVVAERPRPEPAPYARPLPDPGMLEYTRRMWPSGPAQPGQET
jgi:hypothetical protein